MEAINLLKKYEFSKILDLDYSGKDYFLFDFSRDNVELSKVDLSDVNKFNEYVSRKLVEKKVKFGVGKYDEDRTIYKSHKLFDGKVNRTIHLGIDLWAAEETGILAPLDGKVHSFANNAQDGDYGPTIILEHNLEGKRIYTLYGHLSLQSLNGLFVGKVFKKGEKIASIGHPPINGNWPPHLHFQIILDMLDKKGDFPGVCSYEDREKFLKLCPNPNLILRIIGI